MREIMGQAKISNYGRIKLNVFFTVCHLKRASVILEDKRRLKYFFDKIHIANN